MRDTLLPISAHGSVEKTLFNIVNLFYMSNTIFMVSSMNNAIFSVIYRTINIFLV